MWIGRRDQFENDIYYWLDGMPIDNFVTFWAGDIYLFYFILEWVWIGGRDQFENDVYYWLDGTPIDNFDTFWAGDIYLFYVMDKVRCWGFSVSRNMSEAVAEDCL